MRSRRLLLAAGVTVGAACTQPGPRGAGRGEAAWQDDPPVEWAGPCVYEVQTRWATSLPHILTLRADSGGSSVVLSGPRPFPTGRTDLSPTGRGGIQGLVFDGSTVRGAVLGTLEVSRVADSTFIEVVGTKARADTVPLRMACRLGPL